MNSTGDRLRLFTSILICGIDSKINGNFDESFAIMQQPGFLNTTAFLLTVASATRAAAQRDRAIAQAIDCQTRDILRDTDRRLDQLAQMLDLLDDDDDDA